MFKYLRRKFVFSKNYSNFLAEIIALCQSFTPWEKNEFFIF